MAFRNIKEFNQTYEIGIILMHILLGKETKAQQVNKLIKVTWLIGHRAKIQILTSES